jgi:DNA-binding beta-propeller fold protein YncE
LCSNLPFFQAIASKLKSPTDLHAESSDSHFRLPNRRELLALGAVFLGSGCGRKRATGFPGYAVVGSAGEQSAVLVDLNTFRVASRLPLKAAPSLVIADSDRGYVLTPSNGTVHLIDCTRQALAGSWRLKGDLNLIRITPGRPRLVATSPGDGELVVADPEHRKVLRRVKLAATPGDLDIQVHSRNRRMYAALSGGRSGIVEVVDLESGAHRKRQIDGDLGCIRFRKDGEVLFAGGYNAQVLHVLDTETLETICELPLPMRPDNLTFSADKGQLFVSGSGMDGISIVFAYRTIEVEQTVLAGYQPGVMACSDNPNYLFVASRGGSEISILNIDSRKIVALTQVGTMPSRIAITPDQQYALVLNEGSGDLAVIRIPAIGNMRAKAGTLPSGIITLRGVSLFAMIPIGQRPTDLAVFEEHV